MRSARGCRGWPARSGDGGDARAAGRCTGEPHLLISKDALDKGKRVATRVNALAADHRREEIARIRCRRRDTAEARAARSGC